MNYPSKLEYGCQKISRFSFNTQSNKRKKTKEEDPGLKRFVIQSEHQKSFNWRL